MIHKWATRRPARGRGGPRHGRRAAGTPRRRLLSALVLALDAALASSGSCLERLCGSARLGGAIDAHLLKIVIEEELGFRVELVRRRIVGRLLTSKEAIFCHRNEAPFYPRCLVVHSSATFSQVPDGLGPVLSELNGVDDIYQVQYAICNAISRHGGTARFSAHL